MGYSLRDLRRNKLLSQRELTNLMGMRDGQIRKLESGKRKLEICEAKKLSIILSVTLDDIYNAYKLSKIQNL
ncbi:helix-turn-helix transcriptional regulator [Clostridium baratii]|uniref:helix-turn-helix transcriptional regulator n=1 Tax=Clostridium baratii TaxID=1561 RepID=UPI0030CE07E7